MNAPVTRPKCAVCGMSAHRYGTSDPEHEFDAVACVNMLLPEVEKLRALLDAARYVLAADYAGWPGHTPLVHLREAVEAFDG